VYGVLTVGATDANAFGDDELAMFTELGQTLGTAFNAIQTKRLLHASGFLELELDVWSETMPLIALNEHVGGTWTLEGVVPIEEHEHLLYVDAAAVDPAAIEAVGDDFEAVESLRVLRSDENRTVFEMHAMNTSPISALIDAGGWIRGATIADGQGTFVVDVTLDTDVRAYMERVEHQDVEVSLLAKREVDRTAPAGVFGTPAEHDLTDRQRAVLEAAYYSGYYAWPRRQTTGEALAASLDISSSTLYQHLRVATRKVLEQYLEVASTRAS
jgi:predicted DNA binding protein